jgi:hypothetical protein
VFSVCWPEQEQHFSACVVDHRDAAEYVDGNHSFTQGLQHRLTLLKQRGDFVRFKTKQDAFQDADQTPDRHRTHQDTEQDGPDGVLPPAGDLLFNFIEEIPTTTTPICSCCAS